LPGFASAQSTWVGATSDWNTGANWNPVGVPAAGGTAIFDALVPPATTSITFTSGASVGALQFNAPGYVFNFPSLLITGSGIQATPANAPTFNSPNGGPAFTNSSTAGPASINVFGEGAVDFHNTSKAGTATMTAGLLGATSGDTGGFIIFHDNSTADHATITAYVGSNIEFHDASSADHATLIVGNPTVPVGAADNGFLFFNDTATLVSRTLLSTRAQIWISQIRFLGAARPRLETPPSPAVGR
jgi:hypothetical protein